MFSGLAGLWIALSLLKFGNPVILDHQVPVPESWLEVVFQSWPVSWGYGLFLVVLASSFPLWQSRNLIGPCKIVAILPAVWLGWQCLSATRTIRSDLTGATLPHFLVCTLAFYIGLFAVPGIHRPGKLWLGIAGGWVAVVLIGWRQHFGGLAEMREFFYAMPDWRDQPPELIAKVASNRIFATLVYPNALAGAILLFTPGVLAGAWCLGARYNSRGLQLALSAVAFVWGIGCLVWSESKAGWLIGVGIGAATVAFALSGRTQGQRARDLVQFEAIRHRTPPGPAHHGGFKTRDWRIGLVIGFVLLLGGTGFWLRYRTYFEKGATSVSARFTYWSIAISNSIAHPLLGTGPGTFMEVYRRDKPPGAEMTRLAHNDYLQQASDAGFPGALLLIGLVGGTLALGNGLGVRPAAHPVRTGVWLGVAGFAAQSTVEFGLYIPALAWPWFLAMGALLGSKPESPNEIHRHSKTVDKKLRSS